MVSVGEDTQRVASAIVLALCGGRWVYPPVRMVDEYPLPRSGVVFLSGRPVIDVHSVRVDGVEQTDYRVMSRIRLEIGPSSRPSRGCCGNEPRVEVDYTYGHSELPDLVANAIDVMAHELCLADSDDSACRIPERVTSVNRQGMSWTLIDPQDFLQDGRTGIYEVDQAIKAVNPANARRRARIFTPTSSTPALRRKP